MLFIAGLVTAIPAVAKDFPYFGPAGSPASAFPKPDRPVAGIISPIFHTEDERDAIDESGQLIRYLGIKPGMTVADIGAGSGYDTVRLAKAVGAQGRILAEDVTPSYLSGLAERVRKLKLQNVAIGVGEPHDPRLPPSSLDAAIMVYMYHEIAQPYGLLYNLVPALKPGARVGILDLDAATQNHGTPPALLRCEVEAVGYRQTGFHKLKGSDSYLAIFEPPAAGKRPAPAQIAACKTPTP